MLTSALAGTYTVRGELGRGGMATVYVADDVRHGRQVAVKVLRAELAAAIGTDRFLREIEVAARLTHPHILPLYDSGEAQGRPFYVTPYLPGQTLRDRLKGGTPLPIDEALRLARELASALGHAHTNGLLHRDVKPENVLLSGGHAVLADFGLVRALSEAGGTRLTATGMAVGTVTYMSPEQAAAEAVDERTDVYSLGCVLFEMLAGEPPYTGSAASIIAKHLGGEVPSVRTLRELVSPSLDAAIRRAMAKLPADRFASMGEFAEALRPDAVVPVPSPPRARWRRVLPAAAIAVAAVAATIVGLQVIGRPATVPAPSSARSLTILADPTGAAEPGVLRAVRELLRTAIDQSGILASLGTDRLREALAFAGRPDTTTISVEIARELAVRASIRTVITASLERLGETFVLSVRVLDARDGSVIALQDGRADSEQGLIGAIDDAFRALRERLGEDPARIRTTSDLEQVATPSFPAYTFYAEAVEGYERGTADDRDAIRLHRSALDLDPGFAAAWYALGVHYMNLGIMDSAEQAYDEALRRPERLAERDRLNLEGVRAYARWDLPRALEAFSTIAQRFGVGRHNLAVMLEALGRNEDALAHYRVAAGDLQNSGQTRRNQVRTLLDLGRLDDADDVLQQLEADFHAEWSLRLAAARGDWPVVDSLGAAVAANLAFPVDVRVSGRAHVASVRAAHGAVDAATRELQRAVAAADARPDLIRDVETLAVLLAVVGDRPVPALAAATAADTSPPGLVHRALHAAVSGDTARARALLVRVAALAPDARRRLGSAPAVVEAAIAGRAGNWRAVVDGIGPAVPWVWPHRAMGTLRYSNLVRWWVARAYAALDMPDSAAAHFAMLADPAVAAGARAFAQPGFVYPFALYRLLVTHAAAGRMEQAQADWRRLAAVFTTPDSSVAPLLVEAARRLAGER